MVRFGQDWSELARTGQDGVGIGQDWSGLVRTGKDGLGMVRNGRNR